MWLFVYYVLRANSVTIHKTPYKLGSVIHLKVTELESTELESKFEYAQIKELYVRSYIPCNYMHTDT